jgi:RNA polymerase sigma factor (sigma-70 family)
MSEKALIDALRTGSGAAWAEMVGLYLKLVYHVVRKTLALYGRGRAEEDVEDITHDLFQSLVRDGYRALASIREPYDLKAWLAISARRRAIDFVRRKRVPALSLDEAREGRDRTLADAVASPETAPEDPARAEHRYAVNQSLAALNPRERLVVQLFYLKGKKYREIAAITGVNQNSISPTLMRAVEKMQKYLLDRNLLSRRP